MSEATPGRLLAEASPSEIGEELARRGREAVRHAIAIANLRSQGDDPGQAQPHALASPPVAFIMSADRWVPLSELRRRFQGPAWKGQGLIDAINQAGSYLGIRQRDTGGRKALELAAFWIAEGGRS